MAATHRSRRMRAKAEAAAAAAAALKAGYQGGDQHHHSIMNQRRQHHQGMAEQQQYGYPSKQTSGNHQHHQFQNSYHNNQQSSNLLSHPIYNLAVPPINPIEGQILNDESDVYSFRLSALEKFKFNNNMLENVVNKAVPFHKIIPPSSFPKCVIDGKLYSEPTVEDEEAEKLILEVVKANKVDDYLFGSLKVMKMKEAVLEDKLKALEAECKDIADIDLGTGDPAKLVDERYAYQLEKMGDLKRSLSGYSVEKAKEYDETLAQIESDMKTKFNREIKEDSRVKWTSISSFDKYKKSVEYAGYKATKEAIRKRKEEEEMQKLKEAQELAERKRLELEEKLRLEQKRKLEDEEAQKRIFEEQRLLQEANQRAAAERAQAEAEAAAHAQAQQQQQQQVQVQAQAQHLQQPMMIPGMNGPVPQPMVASGNNFDDPFAAVVGSAPPNGNFDFDSNLLYGAGDDLIIDDETGFGSLDDQVFLSNLDVNLE
ncbi:hypothetical protein CANARDRAFT_26174 [[Candida] arabinofermentans NRRL YB-2248]|uniref:Uncharacterized protein n=1 Tax=[Candida] arabinofermentans NRRL YB-2248 TaxID=983967 RepID=A0A1E4T8E2_9ASCO|nr:hypothetical protein CANARDRAFT_26174 [[Candida] arabinofermentans NRRL YB-2248]